MTMGEYPDRGQQHPPTPTRELCTVLLESGRTHLEGGQFEQAHSALGHALALARASDSPDLLHRALASLGQLHLRCRRYDEARQALEEAAAAPQSDEMVVARSLIDLAEANRHLGRLNDAERAARYARREGFY